MCKTMVRNDPVAADMQSRTTMVPRKIISGTQPEQKTRSKLCLFAACYLMYICLLLALIS